MGKERPKPSIEFKTFDGTLEGLVTLQLGQFVETTERERRGRLEIEGIGYSMVPISGKTASSVAQFQYGVLLAYRLYPNEDR